MSYGVLVADNETYTRSHICSLLQEIPGYYVCGCADNGNHAVTASFERKADVVLLDIHLSEIDGLTAAKRINEHESPPKIILVSAFHQYTSEIFEAKISGYLVKPVRMSKLKSKLDSLWDTSYRKVGEGRVPFSGRSHIWCHQGFEDCLIAVNKIVLFRADSKYTSIIHQEGRSMINETLCCLEKEFSDRFLRIHRNALVNTDYIRGMTSTKSGKHVLHFKRTAEKAFVSRRHFPRVRAYLKRFGSQGTGKGKK